jgi:hypothetical protein
MTMTCDTCFHRDVDGDKAPCDTCCSPTPHWEPIQYKPEDVALNKRALDIQVAGNHYKELAIQPVEYIHANNIGYFEGNVIKYVSRWRNKNGVKDLEKAKHYIDLLIELEGKLDDKSNSDI